MRIALSLGALLLGATLAAAPARAAPAAQAQAAAAAQPQCAENAPIEVHCRIVGGIVAVDSYAPWQVSFFYDPKNNIRSHFCSGALIAPDWVLTAAHCVTENVRQLKFQIYARSHDLRSGGSVFAWDRIYVHKDWNPQAANEVQDSDIALVHLAPQGRSGLAPVLATAAVLGAADAAEIAVPARVTVSGWGQDGSGAHAAQLRLVDLPVKPDAACAGAYPGLDVKAVFCAGGESGRDACKGDSGGPVVLMDAQKRQVVVGVVSGGPLDCGTQGEFGVYTRVSHYADWIVAVRASYPQDAPPRDALLFKPSGS